MWIRITCPNGHPLEKEDLEHAARSWKCPRCRAPVSMWTKVFCQNGHALKVRTRFGGATGVCPECQSPVVIPALDVNEIIHLLVPLRKPGEESEEDKQAAALALNKPPKTCPDCGRSFSGKLESCPHCHPGDGLRQFFGAFKRPRADKADPAPAAPE